MKDKLDIVIDNMLKAPRIGVATDFTNKTLSMVRTIRKEELTNPMSDEIDTSIDEFLARMPLSASEPFTNGVIKAIRRANVWKHSISIIAGISVAACAIFATTVVIKTAPSLQIRPALTDIAQMTEMADEIANLNTLIVQEEFLDYMKF